MTQGKTTKTHLKNLIVVSPRLISMSSDAKNQAETGKY